MDNLIKESLSQGVEGQNGIIFGLDSTSSSFHDLLTMDGLVPTMSPPKKQKTGDALKKGQARRLKLDSITEIPSDEFAKLIKNPSHTMSIKYSLFFPVVYTW
jgi:hypothetical protein